MMLQTMLLLYHTVVAFCHSPPRRIRQPLALAKQHRSVPPSWPTGRWQQRSAN